jgi:hypothetical protein
LAWLFAWLGFSFGLAWLGLAHSYTERTLPRCLQYWQNYWSKCESVEV